MAAAALGSTLQSLAEGSKGAKAKAKKMSRSKEQRREAAIAALRAEPLRGGALVPRQTGTEWCQAQRPAGLAISTHSNGRVRRGQRDERESDGDVLHWWVASMFRARMRRADASRGCIAQMRRAVVRRRMTCRCSARMCRADASRGCVARMRRADASRGCVARMRRMRRTDASRGCVAWMHHLLCVHAANN